MNNTGFPISVLIKDITWDKPREALLYAIHHDKDDNPYATCYLIHNKTWYITQLGFVHPILPNNIEKRILNE